MDAVNLLRLHTWLNRSGSRAIRDSVWTAEQGDLVGLKYWTDKGPFNDARYPDEEPLPFKPLDASDVLDGLGFDQFSALVWIQYAVPPVDRPVQPADPAAMDISPSTPAEANPGGLQPHAASPAASATDSALFRHFVNCVEDINGEGDANGANRSPRDTPVISSI